MTDLSLSVPRVGAALTERELMLGLYEKALPAGIDWHRRLELAGTLGFRFVEISIDETDDRLARLGWSKGEKRQLREAVATTGVAVPSMCLSGHRRFPLGSHDPAIRNKALKILEDAIHFSVDVGIRTVQLAGYDVYYEEGDEQTRAWFIDGLRAGLEMASREQVMLAIEIMDHPLMSSIVKYLNIEKHIKSPWLRVYPDVGNLSAWGNDVAEELELAIDQVVAIHLKETIAVTASFPGQFKEVAFGQGCVDFVSIFRRLAKLGYRGPFTIEMWTEKAADAVSEIKRAKQWITEKMEQGGYLCRR